MRRLAVVAALSAAWVLLIAARLYHLQVVRYEHYTGKAERQQQRVVTLDPPRGTIYDAHGRELAVSIQVDSAYAVPPEIADPAAAARAIAGVVPGLDAAKLARQLAADREFVWVARKLDPPVAAKVRGLGLKGLYFLPESKRYYPMGELAAQVLGYVGTDNHGLAGLELVYDQEVAGKPGVRTVLRDARRGTVVSPDLSFAEPEPGHDLYLTLDAAVQHVVERELAKAVEERGAKRGSAIFLDPETGGVLAMATYPSFDPNDFGRYDRARWKNRAITDVYEPGSTFKIVTAAAALESGVVHADDEFDCEMGGITLLGIRIRDHKPFGRLSFAQVLAKSSNVGVIKAALLVGSERLYRTIRGFGFGQPTGIDLPGESGGILHPLERWGPLAKAYISFGQGVSVTPLQLTAAAAAVANEGRLLRPHVVAAVSRGEVRVPKYSRPPVVGNPISPATARELKRLLEGVVTAGTGRAAAVDGYRVAGKTGTAQIPVPGGYLRNAFLPSFVGFAPADRPALVGVVAVAEPQGFAYHGGQVAAPVFGAIARQVLLYRGVHPQRERLAVWPGEMVMARLPGGAPARPSAAPAVDADDIPTDGDDWTVAAGPDPVLWRGPSPAAGPARTTGESRPGSERSSAQGGRSHAPF
ncbi:MAG TPA: penicillin-binding transpeptidase domain-containing protein [Thermoanaerobaculia bacterium]